MSYLPARVPGVEGSDADGTISWPTGAGEIRLQVVGGDVVAGPDKYVGRDGREVWREAVRAGHTPEWEPDPPHAVIESWTNNNFGTLTAKRVKLATNGVTWQVQVRKGKTEGVLRYPDEAAARQELALLLSGGEWRQLSL